MHSIHKQRMQASTHWCVTREAQEVPCSAGGQLEVAILASEAVKCYSLSICRALITKRSHMMSVHSVLLVLT